MVFRNNKLEMSASINESVSSADLYEQAVNLTNWYMAQLNEFRILLPEDYEIIADNGLVQYGDIVKGKQIIIKYKDIKHGNKEVEKAFVFSEAGELEATLEGRERPLLAVYDIFGFGDFLRVSVTTYTSVDGVAIKLHETREEYKFNKGLDQTSFASN